MGWPRWCHPAKSAMSAWSSSVCACGSSVQRMASGQVSWARTAPSMRSRMSAVTGPVCPSELQDRDKAGAVRLGTVRPWTTRPGTRSLMASPGSCCPAVWRGSGRRGRARCRGGRSSAGWSGRSRYARAGTGTEPAPAGGWALRQYVGDFGHSLQPPTRGLPAGAHAPGSPQHSGGSGTPPASSATTDLRQVLERLQQVPHLRLATRSD